MTAMSILGDKFAQGVGAASGILLIGNFGRLYRRNKLLGHAVGTIIIGTLAFASYQYTNSPKPADTPVKILHWGVPIRWGVLCPAEKPA